MFELSPPPAASSFAKPKARKRAAALFAAITLNTPGPGTSHQGSRSNFVVCQLVSLPVCSTMSSRSIERACLNFYVEVRQDTRWSGGAAGRQ